MTNIYQMTATLSKGDAIGNYIITLKRIFQNHGFGTEIFSDGTLNNPHSSKYVSSGNNILWFHYSIYSDNLRYLDNSDDKKIIDFHGVTPPHLFKGVNAELEILCKKGNDLLRKYADVVDLSVVHSEYSRSVLEDNGYRDIIKLPLVVDVSRLEKIPIDSGLANLLKQIKYILFVGRIVPQKSIISIINSFFFLKKYRPEYKLFLVGDYNTSPTYKSQILGLIEGLDLKNDVILTGKLDDIGLKTFYKYASLFIILSEWETFCVPLIEAMYYQVPVVACDKTAIPEILGDAGILVHDTDPVSIAGEINDLLNDKQRYESLKLKSSSRIRLYTERELERQLEELLDVL